MYTITKNSFGQTIIVKTDGNATTSFSEDPANTDYQQYLAWLAEGNEPSPPDEQQQG